MCWGVFKDIKALKKVADNLYDFICLRNGMLVLTAKKSPEIPINS